MQSERGDTSVELLGFERAVWGRGYARIAGVDEVGRGPLAGPVVAAAVILPSADFRLPVADSKSLSAAKREELAAALFQFPGIEIGISSVSVTEIDGMNILRASHMAMRNALRQLRPLPDFALVDGLSVPDLAVPAEFIVRGDARSASIAAASIVAKVHRDRLMVELDERYPGYGFARNKGYGTAEHIDALARLGACPEHRRSFAPVSRSCSEPSSQLEFDFSGRATDQ